MARELPLLPTTVCGSHALPSGLHLDRLGLGPDGGLWATGHRVAVSTLRSGVEAARLLRRELGAKL